jgi:hypothetical protein
VLSRVPLVRHPLSLVGAAIATASALGFLALILASAAGMFTNPYAGLVIFVTLPVCFVAGLLLIPAGMWLQAHVLRRDPGAATQWPVVDLRQSHTRRVALVIVVLTMMNAAMVLVAGYGTLHWMESPSFCGQVCHTPMHPQFTAWQNSSHAKVACVTCHIGEGGRAFAHYKLAGVRQLAHVTTNRYPRPIRGADLRPALETCGACHVAARVVGDTRRTFREYADDQASTETVSIMQLHVGGAAPPTGVGRAIHWHADPRIRIEYIATDEHRETIPYVKVTDAQGREREFRAEGTTPAQLKGAARRLMDCVDCHNAVGHGMAPTPEKAVDAAIAAGRISRQLPFIRREGVRLVSASYPTQEAGLDTIARELRQLYASSGQATDPRAVEQTVATLQSVYARNVFPTMKVTWGTYPTHLGHLTSTGCFRCHDGGHTAKDGRVISADCEYCHTDTTSR